MLDLDVQNIALIIFGIIIIYLLYKTRNVEGFAVTDDVRAAINEVYMADIGAIRNLSSIAKEMTTNNDTLTLPATTVKISGKLEVDGDVEFINKNTGFINHMPKFTVLSIATETVPKGWALCDGKTYKLNSTGVAYEVAASDTTGTITPDLRGRFILGGGQGIDLTNRVINNKGGKETMTVADMPQHNHDILGLVNQMECNGSNCKECTPSSDQYYYQNLISYSGNQLRAARCRRPNEIFPYTGPTGGNVSQNNMPPFYVLIYIMKL